MTAMCRTWPAPGWGRRRRGPLRAVPRADGSAERAAQSHDEQPEDAETPGRDDGGGERAAASREHGLEHAGLVLVGGPRAGPGVLDHRPADRPADPAADEANDRVQEREQD